MIGINVPQLRLYVVRPTLQAMGMWSAAAEALLLGTAAVESHSGAYIRQFAGPARGIFQVEPATALDLLVRYLSSRPDIARRFEAGFLWPGQTAVDWGALSAEQVGNHLTSDLRFCAAVCRLRYWVVPDALPSVKDVPGLARYWKQHYNTRFGRGTEDEFIDRYSRLVLKRAP